jgi:AraC-like DNA-binding protein/ligand-binding sensor protein
MDFYAKTIDFSAQYYYNVYMKREINYIFHEEIAKIIDSFKNLFNIKVSFFSIYNDEETVTGNAPWCEYCRMLRTQLGLDYACRNIDAEKQKQSLKENRLVTYVCHGGMTEGILPVYNIDKPIGYMMIGQFRQSDTMPLNIREQWQSKFGNDDLYEAFCRSPVYDKLKIQNIFMIFSLLVEVVAQKHLVAVNNSLPIMKLLSHIKEHPEINISTTEAASMLNCSTSYLTHNFRKITGQSFKKYAIEQKLAKADELLESKIYSTQTIYEIAKAVGYKDPFMFSRIYKKYRGRSPSKQKPANTTSHKNALL